MHGAVSHLGTFGCWYGCTEESVAVADVEGIPPGAAYPLLRLLEDPEDLGREIDFIPGIGIYRYVVSGMFESDLRLVEFRRGNGELAWTD
jgi:hypothetical protein